jgi:hypothetical protein
MPRFILTFLVFNLVTLTHAQPVADFSLTNVATGKPVTLTTYPTCAGLVVIFTSNACAYDEYYRDRIASIAAAHPDDVPLLLVNSGVDPQESIDNMSRKAKALGLRVPYLADKDQVLMKQLGAARTPQAFLLKNNNGKFSVVYNGALDDNPQVPADVRHAYLKDAIDIMLSNQRIETPEVRPVGCAIRKK